MKKLLVLLALCFSALCGQSQHALAGWGFVLMDPTDGQKNFDQFLVSPQVDGIALRLGWNRLELKDGQYNWSVIDNAMELALAYQKKITLHISATATPAWLYNKGVKGFYGRSGGAETVPWDTAFLTEWNKFLQDLSAHLTKQGYMDRVAYISAGAPIPEMTLASCRDNKLGNVLYNRISYLASWKFSLKALAKHFPTTPKLVMIPSQHICAPDKDGPAFLQELFKVPASDKIILFTSDLNAKGSVKLNSLGEFGKKTPVHFRMIGAFSDTSPRYELGGTLKDAICTGALKSGSDYFEIYKSDFLSIDPTIQEGLKSLRDPRLCSLSKEEPPATPAIAPALSSVYKP